MKTGVQRRHNLQICFLYLLASFPGIQRGKKKLPSAISEPQLLFLGRCHLYSQSREENGGFLEAVQPFVFTAWVTVIRPLSRLGSVSCFAPFFLVIRLTVKMQKVLHILSLFLYCDIWLHLAVFNLPLTPKGKVSDVTSLSQESII